MTECISEGLYRIPVPLPGNPLRELNSYLLRGRERSLLIDTGFRQEEGRRALFAGLAELDVDATLWDDERFTRRAQKGLCLEDGVWLFSLEPPEGGYPGDWYEGAMYTLRLYREDGGLLLERNGVIEIC